MKKLKIIFIFKCPASMIINLQGIEIEKEKEAQADQEIEAEADLARDPEIENIIHLIINQ